MDLPKNITQIGEADAKCKIYVEDYVVSFLKQLNPLARDKTMAAALYGKRKTEEDKTYLFVYGAGKLDFIQKETRHLSQAQNQEIERIRRQYFSEYEFLGYRILDGEMVEGFHVCEQDICRYVSGYAQFYEKNEAMLAYMLESRQVDAAPESVDNNKYESVREKQEKRRIKYFEAAKKAERESKAEIGKREEKKTSGVLRFTAAAILVVLCLLGLAMNSSVSENGKFDLTGIKDVFAEKMLPDDLNRQTAEVHTDVLTAQDKLADAIKMENLQTKSDVSQEEISLKQPDFSEKTEEDAAVGANSQTVINFAEKETKVDTAETEEKIGEEAIPETDDGAGKAPEETEKEPVKALTVPSSYIVCKGDTLIGISIRNYGNDSYVKQICDMNKIQDPDQIKVGQKILLP